MRYNWTLRLFLLVFLINRCIIFFIKKYYRQITLNGSILKISQIEWKIKILTLISTIIIKLFFYTFYAYSLMIKTINQ